MLLSWTPLIEFEFLLYKFFNNMTKSATKMKNYADCRWIMYLEIGFRSQKIQRRNAANNKNIKPRKTLHYFLKGWGFRLKTKNRVDKKKIKNLVQNWRHCCWFKFKIKLSVSSVQSVLDFVTQLISSEGAAGQKKVDAWKTVGRLLVKFLNTFFKQILLFATFKNDSENCRTLALTQIELRKKMSVNK